MEASLIMPMVLILLLFCIYWGFYCYDKSVLFQCSYLAALRGSNEWEMSNTQAERFTEQQLETLTGETLLYAKTGECAAEAGLLQMRAEVKGGMKVPFSNYKEGAMENWNMEKEKGAYRVKPASFIRKYRIFGK